MNKKTSGLKLYMHYVSINVRSIMQYKSSFLLTALGQFLTALNTFLGIYFMFKRFPVVKGYSYEEVVLCFGMILLQFSLAETVARGFDNFSPMVRKGEFDRVLVRPRSAVLQVLGTHFEVTRFMKGILAMGLFVYAVKGCEIHWSVSRIMTLIFMIIGGTMVFSGLFMIYAALCFFTLEGLEFMNVFTDGAREFGRYPLDIYGKRMLTICTFIVPYALFQYYPLSFILGRNENLWYVFFPLISMLFMIPSYILWRCGVRHYESSGS